MPARPFFLPTANGQRFCLYHAPHGGCLRGRILYIHPFAEEMNLSRRMAALQARALALAGYAVLQIDLHGCGDSAGDFGDARWEDWVNDVLRGAAWLREQAAGEAAASHQPPPDAPLWLWGLRGGCLLALQAAEQLPEPCHLLLWQPPASGKQLLQQFLRLRLAADMLAGEANGGKNVMRSLRQELQQEQSIEVAGYVLSPALARGLEQAVLVAPPPATPARRVEWFEVSELTPPRLGPLPAGSAVLWQSPGIRLARLAIPGPAFWQSGALAEAPALLVATTAALCSEGP
jgi:exosortase A-associated hydrolase 2